MITVVQLRVLRSMLDTNVMLTSFGEAFFRDSPGDVRKQTIVSLERKGLVEEIAGHCPAWHGTEYQITDAGWEAVGGYVSQVAMNEQVGGLIAELRAVLRRFDRDDTVSNRFDRPMGKGVRVHITYLHAERIRELIKARVKAAEEGSHE